MKKTALLLVLFVIILSCKKTDFVEKGMNTLKYESPYQAFYETLETGKLSDTILVQSQSKIFGCGTAAYEYFESLKKSGLDKFYTKYSDVLSNKVLINNFAKKNNLKILWVTRGNEGEKMELSDSLLHKNTNLEKRLWATKNFIKLTESPIKLDSVTIFFSVVYPKEKKYLTKEYMVSKVNGSWKCNKTSNDKSEIKDFRLGYYPF